jgi:hypothetical protein
LLALCVRACVCLKEREQDCLTTLPKTLPEPATTSSPGSILGEQ